MSIPAHILERDRYRRQQAEQAEHTIVVNVDTNIADVRAEAEDLVGILNEGVDALDAIEDALALREQINDAIEFIDLLGETIVGLNEAVAERDEIIVDLLTALRVTAEYADLPARPGWAWFDAFDAYGASFAPEQWQYILSNAGIDFGSFIGVKIGSATACWVGGTGDALFDSESAIEVANEVASYVAALREQVESFGAVPIEPHEVEDANVLYKGDA